MFSLCGKGQRIIFFGCKRRGENISTYMIIALSTDNLHDTITDEL